MFSGSYQPKILGILTALTAVSGALVALFDGDALTNPDWTAVIAAITAGIGLFTARQNNVKSETVGAK